MSTDSTTARATGLAVALSPDGQQRIEEATVRRSRSLARREIVAEGLVGGGFVVAASALAATGPSRADLPWGALALLVVCFAILARVRFDVGAGFTVPTQLLFVPMLFLLPAQIVPAAVALGFVLACRTSSGGACPRAGSRFASATRGSASGRRSFSRCTAAAERAWPTGGSTSPRSWRSSRSTSSPAGCATRCTATRRRRASSSSRPAGSTRSTRC